MSLLARPWCLISIEENSRLQWHGQKCNATLSSNQHYGREISIFFVTFSQSALWARDIDVFRYLQSISRMPPCSLYNVILQEMVSSRGLVVFHGQFLQLVSKEYLARCSPICFFSLHIAWFAWLLPSLLLALLHFAASSLRPSLLHFAASFSASLLPSPLHIAS